MVNSRKEWAAVLRLAAYCSSIVPNSVIIIVSGDCFSCDAIIFKLSSFVYNLLQLSRYDFIIHRKAAAIFGQAGYTKLSNMN